MTVQHSHQSYFIYNKKHVPYGVVYAGKSTFTLSVMMTVTVEREVHMLPHLVYRPTKRQNDQDGGGMK